MRTALKLGVILLMSLLPLAGQVTFDFSTPVVIGPAQAPGVWYPDRFPPSGFSSPATAPDGVSIALKEYIAGSDHQPYPGSAFYNTQGRKFDLPANTTSVTIKLFVPSAWASLNGRAAGFWTTAFTAGNSVGDYGIIEFEGPTTSDLQGPGYYPNSGAGFYGWNNLTSSYDFIGLPAGFVYDSWVQLTITLVPGSKFVYTVNSPTTSVSIDSPLIAVDTYIGNVILQGYNYGSNYSIYWGGGGLGGLIPLDFFFYWFFAS